MSSDVSKYNRMQNTANRRIFLADGSCVLLTALMAGGGASLAAATDPAVKESAVKFALVTDLHHADKDTAGSRHYRESIRKLVEAGLEFKKFEPEFLVCLGDLIDAAADVETELGYLTRIVKEFDKLNLPRHFALGNHCVDTLTKAEFLKGVGQEKSYYSFDKGGIHFVVLDACFRSDGMPYQRKNFDWTDPNLSAQEVEWLKDDLANNKSPTLVFVHQRLDDAGVYSAKNAPVVRGILEKAGNVLAVFQGHSHENSHQLIGGIHYCTMVAMVEGSFEQSNGFSGVSVFEDGTIRLTGFRKQKSYTWEN